MELVQSVMSFRALSFDLDASCSFELLHTAVVFAGGELMVVQEVVSSEVEQISQKLYMEDVAASACCASALADVGGALEMHVYAVSRDYTVNSYLTHLAKSREPWR